jgi:hypothetical protein
VIKVNIVCPLLIASKANARTSEYDSQLTTSFPSQAQAFTQDPMATPTLSAWPTASNERTLPSGLNMTHV